MRQGFFLKDQYDVKSVSAVVPAEGEMNICQGEDCFVLRCLVFSCHIQMDAPVSTDDDENVML